MDSVFLSLFNVSITASWLVLAIFALRLVLRKAPKWSFCLLWGMVAIRLVCPFSIESVFSLIPSTQTIDTSRYLSKPYIDTGLSIVDAPVNEYIGSTYFEGVTVPANHFANWMDICGIIWLLGMLVMLAYCAVSYLVLRTRVATATILEGNIRQCETVDSPFVLGIFKPTIYLPYAMDSGDMAHVIAHERAHIRRRDHWWKPIGFVILSVYWFNPVIWLAYIFLCRDIEAACDEKVIRELETQERRDYSTALLNCSVHRRSIAACPLAFGEVGVKERIKNVMDYKKPAFWIVLVAVIVCIAVAVCFLTNPEDEDTIHYSGSEVIEWYCNSVDVEQISLSAFTDTVFCGTNYEIYAVENGNRRPLVSGMPIHNAYFTDISGDGKPEICATVSFGSGIIDDHIVVYDYAAGEMFALWERGEFDYRLELENSSLLVMKSQYPDGKAVLAGSLMITASQVGNGRDLLLVDGNNYAVVDSNPGNASHMSLPKLTLNDVVSLAQKGEALTWQDFSGYSYYDTGSGMNGRIYEIDETFVVSISGDSLHTDPTGIYLVAGWDRSFLQPVADQFTKHMDIRTRDVEAFIAEYSASSREEKISEAILAHYKSDRSDDLIGVESHRIIGSTYGAGNSRPILWETVYLVVLYQEYSNYAGTLEETSGSYIPTAITFNVDSSGKYTLQEYWEPRDGSYFDDDIREKFPLLAQLKAFNHQAYIDELEAECLQKAQKIANSVRTSEESNTGAENSGISFAELEKIKDKLSDYMVEYKIATLDANEMTGMLDVELYERVDGLEELIAQYLDLKYVNISMLEGELRLTVS